MRTYNLKAVTQKDKDLLFLWANDSECRKNSLNTSEITYQEHCIWFDKKLSDESCFMYLYFVEGKPAGQIRIETEKDISIISYSIAKEYRGKGHGSRMISMVEDEVRGKLRCLHAIVKKENIASQNIFEKNGYVQSEIPEGWLFEKKIKE